MVEKDGAWLNDAKIAAGRDINGNTIPLKCEPDGVLDVTATIASQTSPIDVIVDNIVPVSQSGVWVFSDNPSTDANVTSVIVTTSSTQLLPANLNRKGIIIQCTTGPLYVILGSMSASTTIYSYYVLKLNALEIDDFFGKVSAVVSSGSASVQITEKI